MDVGGTSSEAMDMDERITEEHRTSTSGLRFYLHPLVMLSISDHYVRNKVNKFDQQNGGRVLGILLGQQSGRVVDINNSFELVYKWTGSGVDIDDVFLTKKIDQYKQVFPKLDVVGWYSTGSQLLPQDIGVHRTMMNLNETPVYLLFNPAIQKEQKELPLQLFESELHNVNGIPQHIFVLSKLEIESSEAERIAVNQIAKVTPNMDKGTDQVTAHLASVQSAGQMLHSRVVLLQDILQQMNDGTLEYDHSFVRKAANLVQSLPASTGTHFTEDFLREYSDAMLGVYMATLTKGMHEMNEVVDKLNVIYDAPGSGGRRNLREPTWGLY